MLFYCCIYTFLATFISTCFFAFLPLFLPLSLFCPTSSSLFLSLLSFFILLCLHFLGYVCFHPFLPAFFYTSFTLPLLSTLPSLFFLFPPCFFLHLILSVTFINSPLLISFHLFLVKPLVPPPHSFPCSSLFL